MASNSFKSFLVLLFVLATIWSPVSAVYAGCAINVSGSPVSWIASNDSGQSFTAPCSGQLHSITVRAASVTGVTLNIYAGQNVSGQALYTKSEVALGNPCTIELDDSVTVTSGSQYTFHFSGGSGNHEEHVFWNYNQFSGGQAYWSGSWREYYDMVYDVEIASEPTAITSAASSVTTSDATLNGTVNANYASTAVTFEYGTTTGYGTTVIADESPVSGGTDTSVSKAITGLSINTTYHYRVVAENDIDTAYGDDMTFTTLGAPPTKVVLTGPATVLKDGLGALTLTALDASDQPAVVHEDTTFNVSSNTSGTGTFYSDTAGTTTTQAIIPYGNSSVTFYYQDNTFGTPSITATRESGMELGSDTKQIRVSGKNALSFDGSDGYVNCGTIDLSGSALTFEAWVRPVAFQSASPYISSIMGEEENDSNAALLRFGDGSLAPEKPQFVLSIGGSQTKLDGNNGLSTNIWYHLAATYDGSNMRLYINGIEDASKAQTGDIAANAAFWIAGINSNRYLNGQMDEVRVWNVARSADEIRTNMHRELQGNETGLVAYYKMDTGTGTTASDSSGNGNTGTLTNGPTWQTSGAMAGPGNALDFDGSDDYVLGSERIMSNTDNWTIMAWVRLTALQSGEQFAAYNGDDSGGYGFGFDNGQLRGLYGGVAWHNTGIFITAETWNHVAMRRESGTLRFYLNGRLLDYSSTATPNSPSSVFSVGSQGNSRYLYGRVDELSFWQRALSAQEIRDMMCQSMQGEKAGLAAYFRMDQQTGETILYDQTSNGHNGTLTNMDPTNDWVSSTTFNTWIGWESTAWATATNWSRGAAPGSTDNAGLPDYSNTTGYPEGNDPTISGGPTVNHLVLATDAASTLSSDLTVNGNLILNSDFGVGGNNVTVSGSTINTQTLTIGSATVNANGPLDGTGGTIDFTDGGNLKLGDTVTSLGTLDSTQGTVWYAETGDQAVLSGTYFGLETSGSGTKTLSGGVTANGNLTIGAGTSLNTGSDYGIDISGHWTNNGGFTAGSGTVTFSGGETQNVTSGGSSFYQMTINNSLALQDALTAAGPVTLAAGKSIETSDNVTFSNTTAGSGTFDASGGTTAYSRGDDQNVFSGTYSGVSFSGSGNKTLIGAIEVDGNLSIGESVTFDVSAENYGVNVAGDWDNLGTYTARNGTVTFNGDAAQDIDGTNSFYNLTISNTHASEEVSASGSTLTGTNLLNITDGIFVSASDFHDVTIGADTTLELSGDITVSGNWSNSGTLVPGTYTVNLDGTSQDITGDTSFYNLSKTIASADTLTFAAGSTTTITNTMTFQGSSGELLSLLSSSDGTRWNIDPQGTRTIEYLNVKDSNNTNETDIDASSKNCVTAGNNVKWVFDNTAPTVTTQAVDNIGTATATGHGTITNNGYPNPTQHGVCWSTETAPDINDDCTAEGAVTGTGAFSTGMTGLNPNTTYYVRAYATNTAATAYGEQVSFSTEVELPTHVELRGPATVLKNGLAPFNITSLDSVNQTSNVDQNTTFSLSSDSSGDTFYSDAAGTISITSATIPNGSSSVTFYARDTAFGTPTLTATATGGMALGSDSIQIRISGNNALSFDGNDYVSIDSVFGLGNTDVTIESWVYIQSTSASGTIARLGTSDTGFGIGVGDGDFDHSGNELIVLIDQKRWIDTNVSIGTGWHHIAFSVGSSNQVNIYRDGKMFILKKVLR